MRLASFDSDLPFVHHFYHVQIFNVMFESEYIYAQLVMNHLRLVTVSTISIEYVFHLIILYVQMIDIVEKQRIILSIPVNIFG